MLSKGVLKAVRVTMTSPPGRRQSHQISPGNVCLTHLYLLCLFSIPALHHQSTHPQGCCWTDDPSWGAMPSICQQGDCFSALEILAWKINVAAGLRHPSSRHTGPEGVRSGSSPRLPVVCLGRDRTLWNHSSHWQAGFSLQPEPDKANEPGWYS